MQQKLTAVNAPEVTGHGGKVAPHQSHWLSDGSVPGGVFLRGEEEGHPFESETILQEWLINLNVISQ